MKFVSGACMSPANSAWGEKGHIDKRDKTFS